MDVNLGLIEDLILDLIKKNGLNRSNDKKFKTD